MMPIERKMWVLGLAVGLLVAGVHVTGWLDAPQRWLHDQQVAFCQYFSPEPTESLIHLDIDDSTLEAVGAWPWPRSVMAGVLDEIHLAGAKAVGLDVVFSEPQAPRFVLQQASSIYEQIDDDQELATALAQSQNVLLAVAVTIQKPVTDLQTQARDLLRQQIDLSREDFETQLTDIPVATNMDSLFVRSRRWVLLEKTQALMDQGVVGFEAIRRAVLPHLDPHLVGGSPMLNMLRRGHDQLLAIEASRQYSHELIGGALGVRTDLPPIARLAKAAGGVGFVSYLPDGDGVVRTVPLWVDDGRVLLPQLGLALACRYLNVHPRDVRIFSDRLEIPLADGTVKTLQLRRQWVDQAQRSATMFFDIPWVGRRDQWETMYDPAHEQSRQHLPLSMVYQIQHGFDQIQQNNRQFDKAVSILLDNDQPQKLTLNPSMGKAYRQAATDLSDTAIREQWASKIRADEFINSIHKQFVSMDPATLSEQNQFSRTTLLDAFKAIKASLKRNAQWSEKIVQARAMLREQIKGKAVLIGWTATGVMADFVPTSLHHQCPGVVVHGAVFNAVMTGESWRLASSSVSVVTIVLMGMACAWLLGAAGPMGAAAGSFLLVISYLFLNSFVLFDYANVVVASASPMLAVGLVWSLGTLGRFLAERAERARITKRFRSYVDPALVNYVIAHPEEAQLQGQQKELTVVFTDLAGFTTLSEKLGPQTVSILNEYMERMVPIVRCNRGYVNKFLGDGIMFFYGAPQANELHAVDAVTTALQMQQAMVAFNASLRTRDLPSVAMRIGISSGMMVVGDAGSADASDYTVLGDAVNLGARLESANKYTGTWILVNERVCELVGDQFLMRPVGKLQVVGKTQGIKTFEPLALMSSATEEQRSTVKLSTQLVEHYAAGQFVQGQQLATAMQGDAFGAFYQRQCQRRIEHPPQMFDGSIVLEDK